MCIFPIKKVKKSYLFLLMVFLGLLSQACRKGEQLALTQFAIDQTKGVYAPDKRVAIFQITAAETAKGLVLRGATNLPEAKVALLEELGKAGIMVVDSVTVWPAAILEGKTKGVVRVSVANIRSEPKHSSELSTQALLGMPLRIYNRQGEWYLVQTPDDYLGWLDHGAFQSMDEAAFEAWRQTAKVIYVQDNGIALSEPDASGKPVSDLVQGNILEIKALSGDWAQVGFADGRSGYVPVAAVMDFQAWINSRVPDAAHILETAQQYMGRPYLWGGTSPKGMDCSGFTKTVFMLNGVQLPRDASQQVQVGGEISVDSSWTAALPGDLLFFGRKAADDLPEKITHVGIHMGNGQFIHASGDGMVMIESLLPGSPGFNRQRLSTFVRAKRVLQPDGDVAVPRLAEVPAYRELLQ
mgnify:CR=1 FL=1